MIQRIQSFYLLLIIALLIAVFFLPVGAFDNTSGSYEYTAFSIKKVGIANVDNFPIWLLGIVCVISMLLSLITIFLYKKRLIQIRFCRVNSFLLIIFYLIYAFFLFIGINGVKLNFDFSYGLIFPFIALIFDLLAIRAIRKDENLVKSLDRIR
jgi:hypothetical protein